MAPHPTRPASHPRRAAVPHRHLCPDLQPPPPTPLTTPPGHPATAYQSRPKAGPTHHSTNSHHRIRTDRIDTNGKLTLRVNGRLHHIGIGRTHARTPVLMLIHNLHVRIINAATGQLLRELVIDPTRDYQPTGNNRYTRWHQNK